MMAITTDPDHLVIEHGLVVLTHEGGEKGRRYPGGLITLRKDLGPVARRVTLAHEIAHHLAGDNPTTDPVLHARQERRAWEQTARWLIHPDAYAAAETLHGPHEGALAHELGVTTHLVEIWRGMHERTRSL